MSGLPSEARKVVVDGEERDMTAEEEKEHDRIQALLAADEVRSQTAWKKETEERMAEAAYQQRMSKLINSIPRRMDALERRIKALEDLADEAGERSEP